MQITLVQTDIEAALDMYVRSLINIGEDTDINFDLKATRGPEGMTAQVELTQATSRVQPKTTAPKPRAVKAAEPVKAPAEEPETVAEEEPVEQTQEEEAEADMADTAEPETAEEPEEKPARKSGTSIFSKAS